MKQFMGIVPVFPRSDICVYAETQDKARKIALEHFVERLERDLEVVEVKARTERCDICDYAYTLSEVIEQDGERLCMYCYGDKFGFSALSPEDIPF